jgi:hypothetical protein
VALLTFMLFLSIAANAAVLSTNYFQGQANVTAYADILAVLKRGCVVEKTSHLSVTTLPKRRGDDN